VHYLAFAHTQGVNEITCYNVLKLYAARALPKSAAALLMLPLSELDSVARLYWDERKDLLRCVQSLSAQGYQPYLDVCGSVFAAGVARFS
jgi:hypothetical protein